MMIAQGQRITPERVDEMLNMFGLKLDRDHYIVLDDGDATIAACPLGLLLSKDMAFEAVARMTDGLLEFQERKSCWFGWTSERVGEVLGLPAGYCAGFDTALLSYAPLTDSNKIETLAARPGEDGKIEVDKDAVFNYFMGYADGMATVKASDEGMFNDE